MLCIATAAGVLALAAETFTLSWTHSVARQEWREDWEVSAAGLRPVAAEISGPGAGMELPEGAWRVPGGWRYRVALPPQPEVHLAASGATGAGWRLCAAGRCHRLGEVAEAPIRLWSGACGPPPPQG